MKSKLVNFILLFLGIVLTLSGLYVMKFYDVSRLLFAMITALGIIALETSISNLSEIFVEKKYPERAKFVEREVRDERNLKIKGMVASKTSTIMILVHSFIIFTLLFMQVEVYIIILLVIPILIQGILAVVLTNCYNKII